MSETDAHRRRLLAATASVGGIAVVGAAVPFLESFGPSEAAKAAGAPVEAEISDLEPGKIKTVEWRGKPVWILHRSQAMLASLDRDEGLLADPLSKQSEQPEYAANPARAARPPFFVAIGICTHLGCVPTFRPQPGAPDLGADWPGGFYCPCHGSKFDLAGRVFKNVPAPVNLAVPPYEFLHDGKLLIGSDKDTGQA